MNEHTRGSGGGAPSAAAGPAKYQAVLNKRGG